MFITFGNKVKIKKSPETDEKGLTGRVGEIFGETTPSMMDLEIIGIPKEDYAVNVFFEELKESFWFDVNLLENLDNGEGVVITLDGIDKKWKKNADGKWIEESTKNNSDNQMKSRKKWWRLW
jgi:hypothetical protein